MSKEGFKGEDWIKGYFVGFMFLGIGIGLLFVLFIILSKSFSNIWLLITEEELIRYPPTKRINTSLISTLLDEIKKPKTDDRATRRESLNLVISKNSLIFSIII